MSKFTFFSTFAKKHDFGYLLAESFSKFVPGSNLIVYGDADMAGDFDQYSNVSYEDLDRGPIREFIDVVAKERKVAIPKKKRHLEFMFDVVRFCFKSFAMVQHSKQSPTRYMVWVDSDVEFTRMVSEEDLDKLVEEGRFTSYLRRNKRYTETGWIVFDTEHPHCATFFQRFNDMYMKGSIFKLKSGWTDCHAYDYCREIGEKEGVKNFTLTAKESLLANRDHAWNASPLKDFCRHWKGPREGHDKLKEEV